VKQGFVYILTNKRNGTLYTGVTSDLRQRMYMHRKGLVDGFTKKYNLRRLVWYEAHADLQEAIVREKRIKSWRRLWKIRLIEQDNLEWNDLYDKLEE